MMFLKILYITLIVVCFLLCSAETNEEIHRKYMEASINHDIETLRSLTSENIVWILGRYTLVGREEVLGPNLYDAGLENELDYRNVIVKGDTVECELLERNDIFRAAGIDEVRRFPRFIFKDGLLIKKEPYKPSKDMEELSRRQAPFQLWVRKNHPEAIEKFLDSEGNFIFSRENGVLIRSLAIEWGKNKTDNN